MSDVLSYPFLPPPRLPALHRSIDSALVAEVVGEDLAGPLAEVEAAHAAAAAAVVDLLSCRPGVMGDGATWKGALATDSASYVDRHPDGRLPKAWATEQLLEGDRGRWAQASAACRSFTTIRAGCERRLDRALIAERAEVAVEGAAQAWAKSAQGGWERRQDPAEAWPHWREGQQALGAYGRAGRVRSWATGVSLPQADDRFPPVVDHLPPDLEGRGYWLALELSLEPTTVWLRLPNPDAAILPTGAEELVDRALPGSQDRFRALRNDGVHAADR